MNLLDILAKRCIISITSLKKGGATMNNRILFGVLCILLNGYGVPCFLQGNTSKGIKRIVFGVITCGIIALINEIKGITETLTGLPFFLLELL